MTTARNKRSHGKGNQRRPALFPSSCLRCGAKTLDGAALCQDHAAEFGTKPPTEAERMITQPHRARYKSFAYQANRARRLQLARFRCEWPGCRAVIGMDPHDWECDHHVAMVDGGTDDVPNLRAYCLDHHRQKTSDDRSRRR